MNLVAEVVRLSELFQKLSATEQFALRVVSIKGLENFPRANLKLLQTAITKWIEPFNNDTPLIIELRSLQIQISKLLGG